MTEFFNEYGINFANEISNDYLVTFDQAYSLFIIANYNEDKAFELCRQLAVTQDMGQVLKSLHVN
jgi:lipocalin